MSIEKRLDFVLQGRAIYPWAESLGLRGPIEGMRYKKSIPGGETLLAIRRRENVSVVWLLEGTGEPYITSKVWSDADAIELLDDLFAERWVIHLITDQNRLAIVLTRPGSYQVKDGKDEAGTQLYRWVPYVIIEVIVGNLGAKVIAYLKRLASSNETHLVAVSPSTMSSLEKGKIGSYQLSDDQIGLLKQGAHIDTNHPLFVHAGQQTMLTENVDETNVLENYRAMAEEDKQALKRLVVALDSQK